MGRRSYRSLCYAEDKKEKVDVLFFSSYKKKVSALWAVTVKESLKEN